MTAAERVDVVSAGILVADCVARPVVKQPAPGKLEFVDRIGLYSGGSAANTGYALTRLGVPTAVIGRVGRDGFGDFLVAEAARHGCDPDLVRRDDDTPTSATLVTVDAGGERAFLHCIGANARLTPDDVPLERLRARGARIMHLAGYFALPGMEADGGAPTRALFERAHALGMSTSLDCVWDGAGRWADLIAPALALTDVFCPSLAEARAITGRDAPDAVAERLFELGVRDAVALKMGEDGCFVASRDEAHRVSAARVHTVDGTGAGDAFIAGFLAARLRGLPLADCARAGNAAGAMCVTAMGATAGVKGWEDTLAVARTLEEIQA